MAWQIYLNIYYWLVIWRNFIMGRKFHLFYTIKNMYLKIHIQHPTNITIIASRVVRHARSQHYLILNRPLTQKPLFNFLIVFPFTFFTSNFIFISSPSSIAYKLGNYQRKYKQSPCELDTWTSVLIFTTCDKLVHLPID